MTYPVIAEAARCAFGPAALNLALLLTSAELSSPSFRSVRGRSISVKSAKALLRRWLSADKEEEEGDEKWDPALPSDARQVVKDLLLSEVPDEDMDQDGLHEMAEDGQLVREEEKMEEARRDPPLLRGIDPSVILRVGKGSRYLTSRPIPPPSYVPRVAPHAAPRQGRPPPPPKGTDARYPRKVALVQ